MQFSFTQEQDEFRHVLRRFLEDRSPSTAVRKLMETDSGMDSVVWQQICQDLGLSAVHIPETYGGQGFGAVELSIVLEEMGRALLCSPYFASTVLASTAIMHAADDVQKGRLLPALAAGETIGTLAFTEPNGRWDLGGIELTATPSGNSFKLDGVKSYVLDGHSADLIVVAARRPGSSGEDGIALYTVPADSKGLSRTQLKTMDPTRKQARLEFSAVEAELLGDPQAGAQAMHKTLQLACVGLSNEMIGGSQRLFDQAMDYTQTRMQFGRSIASFQAIKHRMADLLIELELSRSAAYTAAEAAQEADADLPALASLAKASASDSYMSVAANTIQLHGGIGFTWDNDTHLWYKRAKSSEVFLGDANYHRELLMQRWGD